MRTGSPSEFANNELAPFLAIDIAFDSGPFKIWNGYGELIVNGDIYTGAGTLINVSSVEETSEVEARGISLTLSGLPPELISIALQENYQNRIIKLYVGAILSNGTIESYQLFGGRLDVMTIQEGADTATITVTAENRLIDLNRPRQRRYTSEDQKALFPGDLGFDYVNDLQERQIEWGKAG